MGGMDPVNQEALAKQVDRLAINQIQRHIFVCADQSKAQCCSTEEGLAFWDQLKKRLAERGLMSGQNCIFRTKANCLRVCEQGPIAVVYPEGTWYHHLTPDLVDRLIDEHLVGGRPLEEYVFAKRPL